MNIRVRGLALVIVVSLLGCGEEVGSVDPAATAAATAADAPERPATAAPTGGATATETAATVESATPDPTAGARTAAAPRPERPATAAGSTASAAPPGPGTTATTTATASPTAAPITGTPATAAAPSGGTDTPAAPGTLKHFMETSVKTAMKGGDMAAVRAALRNVPDFAPEPSWNAGPTGWRAIVDAAIAPDGNVGKSCKGCHEAWQKAYAEKYRERKIR